MGSTFIAGDQNPDWTEAPDSPEWDWGEAAVCKRTFVGGYEALFALVRQVGYAGYVIPSEGQDPILAGLKVKSASLRRKPGSRGELTITYEAKPLDTPKEEGGSEQVPPVETYTIGADKLERPIEDNPRYRGLIRGANGDLIMTAIRGLIQATNDTDRGAVSNSAYVLSGDDEVYEPLANELYLKMKRGMTHYVMYPPTVVIKSFSAVAPATLNLGGYLENPPTGGGLILPTGQWLRQADKLNWNGTWWELERSWLGAEEWDTDIYPSETAPPSGGAVM